MSCFKVPCKLTTTSKGLSVLKGQKGKNWRIHTEKSRLGGQLIIRGGESISENS